MLIIPFQCKASKISAHQMKIITTNLLNASYIPYTIQRTSHRLSHPGRGCWMNWTDKNPPLVETYIFGMPIDELIRKQRSKPNPFRVISAMNPVGSPFIFRKACRRVMIYNIRCCLFVNLILLYSRPPTL